MERVPSLSPIQRKVLNLMAEGHVIIVGQYYQSSQPNKPYHMLNEERIKYSTNIKALLRYGYLYRTIINDRISVLALTTSGWERQKSLKRCHRQ